MNNTGQDRSRGQDMNRTWTGQDVNRTDNGQDWTYKRTVQDRT